MADNHTKLADMIVPTVFAKYVTQRTLEKSLLWQSGIMTDLSAQLIDELGGKLINLPFFNDLTGEDEVVDDNDDISIAGVSTSADAAVKLYRARAYGGSDLAADLAGADPMNVIINGFATYWARRFQAAALSTLKGSMAAANMDGNTLDISVLTDGAQNFDGDSFIDAVHLLGDEEVKLRALAIHSDTLAAMKKADLIDYVKPSDGGDEIATYQGKSLIVDDGMPRTTDGVYTTYIFGPGAIAYAEKAPKNAVETGRDALKGGGFDYIVQRRQFIMHPRGIKWTGSSAKATPSNAELATPGNYTRVYEHKAIRLVKFVHKLPA